MDKEFYDYLTPSGVKIIQSEEGYRFTSDAVTLANFVRCKHSDMVIDAGCGGGVISLIVNDREKPRKIIAVDITPEAAELAKRNISLNSICNIEVHCADIRTFYKTYGANLADIVVCNPPYFSTGIESANTSIRTARHDGTLSLSDLAGACTKLLKFGGAVYFCYPAKYIAKAIHIFESNNFRVKKLHYLQNNKGIYLALVHARKGGGDGTVVTVNKSPNT